jgi:hypothetical protein
MADSPMSLRERLRLALRGERIEHPAYVVYDAFVPNPAVDWDWLFSLGFGQVNHVAVVEESHPNCDIIDRKSREGGLERRDVTIRSSAGELHEYYLGDSGRGLLPWRMEYFIKKPSDYRILALAFEGSRYTTTNRAWDESEEALGNRGVTLAQAGRTPFQKIQIDFAGPEAFSYHIADEQPDLLYLLDLMNTLKLEEVSRVSESKAEIVKLWENLSIDMVGPHAYRKHLVPLYEEINHILQGKGKKLLVHYDGKIRPIADDIARLGLDIDSLTPPPEGDMEPAEARKRWPGAFLWLHPSLGCFDLSEEKLAAVIRGMAEGAGPRLYCFEMSEGVPENWRKGIPAVLRVLDSVQ